LFFKDGLELFRMGGVVGGFHALEARAIFNGLPASVIPETGVTDREEKPFARSPDQHAHGAVPQRNAAMRARQWKIEMNGGRRRAIRGEAGRSTPIDNGGPARDRL
jgi:hypothetical protein